MVEGHTTTSYAQRRTFHDKRCGPASKRLTTTTTLLPVPCFGQCRSASPQRINSRRPTYPEQTETSSPFLSGLYDRPPDPSFRVSTSLLIYSRHAACHTHLVKYKGLGKVLVGGQCGHDRSSLGNRCTPKNNN